MEHDRVKIIVENKIPFFKGLLDDVAQVEYLAPENITPETVADADAIVTRTRTRCDESLLKGSRCSLIASATIGLDHVDIDWCTSHGIEVANAPGCNAPAVAQYVFASLLALGMDLKGKCLGIIGAGHVGGIVADWGRQIGMKVLINDPPREESEGSQGFVSLDVIAEQADVVSIHTPYIKTLIHTTHHLINKNFVSQLLKSPVVINSARGPVADTDALLWGLATGKISQVIMDCWEGEPKISPELLEKAAIATPHIAGYSLQGKQRASYMAAAAVAQKFALKMGDVPQMQYLPEVVTADDIAKSYNPLVETSALKSHPENFEVLRNNYTLRTEVLYPQ